VPEFRRVIELDPKNTHAYINLGYTLLAQGKSDEALAACGKAVELEPKNAEGHLGVGRVLKAGNKFDEAAAEFQAVVELDSKNVPAYVDLGYILQAQGKLDESTAAFAKAVEMETPISISTWIVATCSIVRSGDAKGYRRLCETMEQRFRQSRDVEEIVLVAHVCVLGPDALADRDRIVQLAEQRMELTANIEVHRFWSAHVQGLAYHRAGQHERAIVALDTAQQQPGLTPQIRKCNSLALAMAHHRLGHAAEVAAAFQSVRTAMDEEMQPVDRQSIEVQTLFREAEAMLREQ
jgi:tetratricopeptide (TPR) repeat protein